MNATRNTVRRAALLLAAVGLAAPAMGQNTPLAVANQQIRTAVQQAQAQGQAAEQAAALELAAMETQALRHLADLQRMLRDLQAVNTPDLAKKYQADLMRDGASLGNNARMFRAWRERAAQVNANSGANGMPRVDAHIDTLNQQVAQIGGEVETQMRRVAALHPPISPTFKQYRALLH